MSSRDDTARELAERVAREWCEQYGDAFVWKFRESAERRLADTIEAVILADRAERAKVHIEKAHELAAYVHRVIADYEDWDDAAYVIAQALAHAERGAEAVGWVRVEDAEWSKSPWWVICQVFDGRITTVESGRPVWASMEAERRYRSGLLRRQRMFTHAFALPAPPPAEEGGEG